MTTEQNSLYRVLKNMVPQATFRFVGESNAEQLHWVDNGQENSVTFFGSAEAKEMKAVSNGMNDVAWVGNVRFASTS